MSARSCLGLLVLAGCGGARTAPVARDQPAPAACVAADPFPAATPEVSDTVDVDLPVSPSFEIPPRYPDGALTVRELAVIGHRDLDMDVMVRGHIVWIYDCVTDLTAADPSLTPKQARRKIAADPTLCLRPRFEIADDAGAPRRHAIEIVEVPRHPNALEKKYLSKQELADTSVWRPVPPLAVGDEVEVTGRWSLSGPHGERSTRGLLVYASMTNLTQSWTTPE